MKSIWRTLLCAGCFASLCSQIQAQESEEWQKQPPPKGKGATIEAGTPISPYGIVDFASTYVMQAKQKPILRRPFASEEPKEHIKGKTNLLPRDLLSLAPGPKPLTSTLPELTNVNSENTTAEVAFRVAGTQQPWARLGASDNDNGYATGYFSAPSDMALCAGSGYVLQVVNSVFKVFTAGGGLVSGPLSMFYFYKQNYLDSNGFTDPRCVYDPYYKRFYVVVSRSGGNAGSADYYADALLGVSMSSNPARGWYLYKVDVSSVGLHGCTSNDPCWLDFPTLGFDRYGIWIGGNVWNAYSGGNVAKFWAVGKQVTNGSTVTPQQFYNYWPGDWTSHPASAQGGSSDDLSNGGTMYIVNGGDGYGILYTITQTSRLLVNRKPIWRAGVVFSAQNTYHSVESYQNDFGTQIGLSWGCCESAAYVGGLVYTVAASTVTINDNGWNGIAWYIIDPKSNAIRSQGTSAREGYHLFHPAITASPNGMIVFVSCVTGPGFNNGFGTAMGSIDPTSGDITKFQTFATNSVPNPITDTGDFRTGDYSAVWMSDDGFAYGAAQHSQKSWVGGGFAWGSTVWGRWTP
eukprot:jgi/Botrbrau1/9470/Bobra.0252s0091.2